MVNNNLENDNKSTNSTSVHNKYIYQKRYYLKNKDKFKAYFRKYSKKRRATDSEYRNKLNRLTRQRYLDYMYSDEYQKHRKINMDGYTLVNPEIKLRRKRATDKLDSLPSNIVTIKDMIKYYIYGDKNEK